MVPSFPRYIVRVEASGAHAELMEQDGAYRRLYNLQFVA